MTGTDEQVCELIGVQLGTREIRLEDRIVEDLGAESADIVSIVAAVEERFAISVDEEAIADIRTVGDLARLVAAETGT